MAVIWWFALERWNARALPMFPPPRMAILRGGRDMIDEVLW